MSEIATMAPVIPGMLRDYAESRGLVSKPKRDAKTEPPRCGGSRVVP